MVAEGPCYIAMQPQNRRWASQMGEGYYGRNGTVGLATPQANPTAETEFRALLPEGVGCATVRMASEASDPEARLRAYFTDIADTLKRFDTLAMQAVGLACTGSSYLLGHDVVETNLAELRRIASNRLSPPRPLSSARWRILVLVPLRSSARIRNGCSMPPMRIGRAEDFMWWIKSLSIRVRAIREPFTACRPGMRQSASHPLAEHTSRRLPHYRHRSPDPARRRRIVRDAAGPRVVLESVPGLGDPADSGHRSRRAGPDASDAALGGLGVSHRSTLISRLLQ
ncbi:MAG: hypothetical protein CM15mP74_29680 [Halieaceae bacterium]|nr:MAG: hypothetical protein CM15mP74_29680 [Halieaceae bacterium]